MWVLGNQGGVAAGSRAYWEIDAPSGLAIIGARTEGSGMLSNGVNEGWGWGGGFYWKGSGAKVTPGQTYFNAPLINSPYFGWQIICGASSCNGGSRPGEIAVLGIELTALETSGPIVHPSPASLSAASGWVRGRWPIAFTADGPSGICRMNATLGATAVSQTISQSGKQTVWHQCPAGSFSQIVDTASIGTAAGVPLTMWASDAAYDYQAGHYNSDTVTKSVNIDNSPVGLGLSGPTDAPSTAGAQTITATAQAGPSGVRGIWCSVDGRRSDSTEARASRSGLGDRAAHRGLLRREQRSRRKWATGTVSGPDLADDDPRADGQHGFVRPRSQCLRCSTKHERVRIPARWVTVTVHGHKQRIRLPAETRTVRVVHCHARIVRRRVRVNGRWLVKRVVLLPHTVRVSTKTIRHGARTTISGWLGTARGTAIGGTASRGSDRAREQRRWIQNGGCHHNRSGWQLVGDCPCRPLSAGPRALRRNDVRRTVDVDDRKRRRTRRGEPQHRAASDALGRHDQAERATPWRVHPAVG